MTKRKITFDKVDPKLNTEKIILWKVVGFAVDKGILIFKNTITGEWRGCYMSTGAIINFDEDHFDENHCLPVWDWGRDPDGKQIEEIKKVYEFIKPPPEKNPIHADTCGCENCKELNKVIEILKNQKEKQNDG